MPAASGSKAYPPGPPKPPSESAVRTAYMTFPNDANVHGTVFGGVMLHWIDQIGAMAAVRHCRAPVVTAQIDAVAFSAPLHIGDFGIVRAVVTRTWTSSMEVVVTVDAEHPLTGDTRRVARAYLTFVGVDDDSRPIPVCELVPETDDERRSWHEAEARRQARLASRVEAD